MDDKEQREALTKLLLRNFCASNTLEELACRLIADGVRVQETSDKQSADGEYKRKYEKALAIIDTQIEFYSENPKWTIWKDNAPVAELVLKDIVDISNLYIKSPLVRPHVAMAMIIQKLREAESRPLPQIQTSFGEYPSNLVAYLKKLKENVEQE